MNNTEGEQIKNEGFLKSLIGFKFSDIVFEQHTRQTSGLNIIIICMQIAIMIISTILSTVWNYNVATVSAIINVILTVIVIININLGNYNWKKARYRSNKIKALDDLVNNTVLSFEDKYLHASKILNFNIKHSDDKFQSLMGKWYANLNTRRRENTGYKDGNDNYYYVGDIVFNPYFEDLWLVEKISKEEMMELDYDVPYVFTHYGNKDDYVSAINEPANFIVKCKPDDVYSYIRYLLVFNIMYLVTKEEVNYNEQSKAEENDK